MALSTLARLGFDEPEAAADDLKRLGAWPPAAAPGGARLLADIAASAAPQLAARSLAALAAAHPDPDGFTAQLRRRLGFRRRLVPLVAASRSLGAWLATHPTEADRLADGRRFAAPRPRDELVAEAVATVAGHRADPAAAWDALRRFKRRELLRVAVRDLAGQVLVDEVAAELADLADACLEAALVVATGESGYDPPPMRMAVLGMGKLGGSELNYVSDIDVLFCHEPVSGAEPEAAARAADRVARGVMRGLSAVTPEGTCFEVDANLRPEGRNGPLSRTLGSYLAYWDRWAQPWERQALIKVRPAAGDAALAERFVEEATQRVYPERLDPETVPAVRRMKARVETSAKARAGGDRQVKLGPGGLRDVEFAVQLLQLVHGRHDPGLRSGSTLVALDRLTAAGFVGRADAAQLADAYRFLRLVEHRLQLASERRTHTIPSGEEARRWLARTLGYRDGPQASALERFEADRRRHAVAVRGLHEKLFYRPLLEAFGAVPTGLDPEGASERLAALGFANPGRAMASLRALTSGLSRRATLMRAMLPVMLPWLAEAPDPDGGLAALRVLAEALGDRAAFYGMVRDNPAAAELLCTVLGTSRLLGELLARHPELLTAMADQHRLAATRGPAELVASATAIVTRHAEVAAAWDGLRRFKRRELVRVAVRDLTGDLPVERVGTELSAHRPGLPGGRAADRHARGRGGAAAGPGGRAGHGQAGRDRAQLHLRPGRAVLPRAGARGRPRGGQPGRRPGGPGAAAGAVGRHPRGDLLRGRPEPAPRGPQRAAVADPGQLPGLLGPLGPAVGAPGPDQGPPGGRGRGAGRPLLRRGRGQGVPRAAGRGHRGRGPPHEGPGRVRAPPGRGRPQAPPQAGPGRPGRRRVDGPAPPAPHRRQPALGPGPGHPPRPRRPGPDRAPSSAGQADWLADAYRLCQRIRNLAYLVAGRPVDSLPTDPVALERLARAMGEPGRQRLLEDYRRATRRARRVVDTRFWDDGA